MKKKILIIILLSINILSAYSIKIYVANLNVYAENINVAITDEEKNSSDNLFNKIIKIDIDGRMNIQKVSNILQYSDKVTKSTMDASELCELSGINYLIYGYIEKTNKYYNVEIKLFDNEKKEDRKIFYAKDELANYQSILDDLSYKIVMYMYEILGASLEQSENSKRGFGGIGIVTGAGYYFPMPEWWNLMTGLFCIEHGINIMPVNYFVQVRNFNCYMRFGFYTSYALGMNKPNLTEAYISNIMFKIPVEFAFEIFLRNVFIISIAPQMVIDIIYQKILYHDPVTNYSISFGLSAGIGFEHWFGKRKMVGIGFNNQFNFSFYSEFYADYRIMIYNAVRIPLENIKK